MAMGTYLKRPMTARSLSCYCAWTPVISTLTEPHQTTTPRLELPCAFITAAETRNLPVRDISSPTHRSGTSMARLSFGSLTLLPEKKARPCACHTHMSLTQQPYSTEPRAI